MVILGRTARPHRFDQLTSYKGFDAYALNTNDNLSYDTDPSINRIFLVEEGVAVVTADLSQMGYEDAAASLNGSGTFAYFTACDSHTPIFTIDQMQGFFESVVDNVATASDRNLRDLRRGYFERQQQFTENIIVSSIKLSHRRDFHAIS